MDIARDAIEATEKGTPVQEIRRNIEACYSAKYGAGTPTPKPPAN
ncbi:MAG: hypothetical protein DMG13_16545 [Acidobacteria bacterium]|nr:MAG: hypothetical protein DMG13_16545 [Acidobacteriota bacterium]